MSNLTVRGNPSGTGTFTVESPNSNNSRTITLPDATTTLVGTDATQTLTNKTIQGGALTLGTAQASTSGTAIDFTGIPSWVKRVTVLLNDVSTNGTSPILVQAGTSSGIVTTGYLSTGMNSGTGGNGIASSTAGFVTMNTAVAADGFFGSVQLANITGNTWIGTGLLARSTNNVMMSSAGRVALSAALDRVRITTVNGTDTFDAGTINVMYEG